MLSTALLMRAAPCCGRTPIVSAVSWRHPPSTSHPSYVNPCVASTVVEHLQHHIGAIALVEALLSAHALHRAFDARGRTPIVYL
jgi:hypothetical protein